MYVTVDLRGVFVTVTGQAQFVRDCGDQLHPRNIFVDPNFVTTGASHRNGGMNRLALGFVCVALEALSGVYVLIQRDRMNFSESTRRNYQAEQDQDRTG